MLSVGQTNVEQEQFSVLHAATLQWREEVQFTSHFTLTEGTAASFDEGAKSGIDLTVDTELSPIIRAKGVFNRLGSNIRISLDKQKVFNEDGTLSYRAFDESTSKNVFIYYTPGDSAAVIERRSGRQLHTLAPGFFSQPEINPLKPLRNNEPDPFADGALVSLTPIDPEHVEIVTALTRTNGNVVNRNVRLWTKPALPVVEQITEIVTRKDGKTSKAGAWLKDFTQCPGGMVARNLRFVYQAGGARAMALEWSSNDLGDRAPTHEDFVIKVPQGTRVETGSGRINARELDPSKFENKSAANARGSDGPARPDPPKPHQRFRYGLISLNALVIVAVVSLFLIKRRRNLQ
jgi:hypothetical protein